MLNIFCLGLHVSDSPNPTNDNTDDEEDTVVQRPVRVAPVHPKFSSHLGSDEENEGENFNGISDSSYFVTDSPTKVQASDALVSSDMESDVLTAKQINTEVSKQTNDNTTKPYDESGQP